MTRPFDAAMRIVAELRAAGYEAYLAGGCVRDLLVGREPSDYDVATSATPDIVLRLFPHTVAVGAHFGVVLVAEDAGEERVGGSSQEAASDQSANEKPPLIMTEVATYRSDGAYTDGRRPNEVRYSVSAREDVLRRDFTINGLLLDPQRAAEYLSHPAVQKAHHAKRAHAALDSAHLERLIHVQKNLREAVIDYVGGLRDLEAGVVRAIGKADLRFEEDRLRMLRAVRFAARFGFKLEARTEAAIRRLAPKTATVSRERVSAELTRMLTEGHARRSFELLNETGLLDVVLHEVARMKGVEQPPLYHPEGDVWAHTLLMLDQLPAGCAMTLAWGALLHDVGKPSTFRRAERIRFDGHVEVGVAIAMEICRRFRFSKDETRQIVALVQNHMRFADAPRMKISTLKRFFQLDKFDEHLALHRMDCLAGGGELDNWDYVHERLRAIPEEAVKPARLITGLDLIEAGYRPGARFREMLHAVEDAQLEGLIATSEEAMKLVRERFPVG
jgi:poly(A) polymerase